MIEVNDPKQQDGVSVNHPTLQENAKNRARMGIRDNKPTDDIIHEIVKREGLPRDVAAKIEREARKEKRG